MADNLQFGIKFDLDKGIKDAIGEGEKGLKRLENALAKHPINVKVKLDTGRTRGAQSEMVGFRKQLAELTKEWNTLTAAERGGAQGAALRERYRALQKEAQGYVSTLRAAVNQEDKLSGAADRAATATNKLTGEFRNQDGYVSRLVKRLAVYAGFMQITNFLTSVRDVTAEFELQRISLGAIIQDQNRANQLFSEIKSFALKSPVSILDLTKYTKQLAAYKIGVDELFETTKKLTDISVGLGVSMDRVVLAYGQVRARGALYSSEIRQFTEMGVPIVEELAAKLTKVNGELVTSAQVLKMVEKGAISFEMVKEIFDDMTSAGGMFYNMQEKQGNTLYGMWAKLGDAASVMYEEIGNTSWVNEGMKAAIEGLTDLMRNWRSLAREIGLGVAAYSIWLLFIKKAKISEAAQLATLDDQIAARQRLNAALKSGSKWQQLNARMAMLSANANIAAANATNLFSRGIYKLKAAMLGNWMTAILAAVGFLIEKLYAAYENATRLKDALDKIEEEGELEQNKSVRNFEYLADAAVKAADGSKAQREALEELERTYKNIIPVELLSIENLRLLKGNYDSLTNSIRLYIQEQYKKKAADEVMTEYATSITRQEKKIAKYVESLGVSEPQSWKFVREYSKQALDETKTLKEKVTEAFAAIGIELDKQDKTFQSRAKKLFGTYKSRGDVKFTYDPKIKELNELYVKQETDLANLEVRYNNVATASTKFAKAQANLAEKIANAKYVDTSGKEVDRNSYLGQQMLKNENLKGIGKYLKEEFEKADLEWQSGFGNLIQKIAASKPELISSLDFTAIINSITEKLKDPELKDAQRELLADLLTTAQEAKLAYGELVPTDRTVLAMRSKLTQIAYSVDGTGSIMDKLKNHLMQSGQSWEDYSKSVRNAVKDYETQIASMQNVNASIANKEAGWSALKGYSEDEINKIKLLVEALKRLFPFLAPEKSSGGSQSDPRLQNLKEEISLVQKLYNEYKQLEKQEGATAAAADMRKLAGATIDMFKEKYGFDLPTDAKDLTSALEILYKKMAALSKKAFPSLDKDLKELRWTIEKVNIDESQKKIEAELKSLADRISRTKTAKEFYEKILSQTGDVELAANVTYSIYGEDGSTLFENMVEQIQQYFGSLEVELPIDIEAKQIDYKKLRELWEADKALPKELRKIPEAYDSAIKQILDSGDKELVQIAEQGAKLLLAYDEIAQKRVNIEQEASEKIKKLREAERLFLASNATPEQKEAYSKRTNKAVAGVKSDRDLKLLRLKDEYLRFFSAIHSLTKKEAEKLRGEVRQALFKAFQDGAISADELKRELKAIDEQFNKLIKDQGKFVTYLEGGIDGLINRLRDMADEMMSVGSEIGKMDSVDKISEGQKSFIDTMLKQFGNDATGNSFASLLSNTNGDLAQMGSLLQGISGEMGAMAEGGASALAMVDRIITDVARTIEGIAAIRDQLNEMRSEDNQLGGVFWDAFEYLENFNKYAAQGWENLKSGNVVGAVQNTIQSIISIFGTAQAQRVRRANKEIKRQQELLDQLEYAYGRLEKAAEKAFGGDYISNFKAQQKNLQAQAAAYQKQADAERSKGKKADKDKIKEYEDAYRDTMDKIEDMQGQVAAQMLGTDLTSAARDFAKAWLEAYKEFGNTADAMSEKFHEMIENMVVESLLAKVMERALKPAFDMIDSYEGDFIDEGFWKRVSALAEQGAKDADYGAQTMMKFLEQAGISIRDLGGDLTGISRDIATASEESINGLAAHMNTVEHYVALIQRDTAAMAMNSGATGTASALPSVDYTPLIQQSLANQSMMIRYQAETVTECKRSAAAAENILAELRRVIVAPGTTGTRQVYVRM